MMPIFRIYRETGGPGVFTRSKRVSAPNAEEALKVFVAGANEYIPENVRFIVMQVSGVDTTIHLLKLAAPRQTWDVVSA